MPRLRSDHTQTVRVELGVKERQYVESAGTAAGLTLLLSAAGVAAAGAGIGIAGFAVYQWFKDGPFSDILSPEWRDSNLYIFSEEQKAIYREQNPTLWSQIFDGPAIFWQLLTNPGPPQGG